MIPIRYTDHSNARWHRLVHAGFAGTDDTTEAMNVSGGVLLCRTVNVFAYGIEDTRAPAVSTALEFVPGLVVAQRWTVEHVEAGLEDDVREEILVSREILLIRELDLIEDRRRGHLGELVVGSKNRRFRYYNADEPMPRPPERIVRAFAADREPPSEADALRSEIDALQRRLVEAEGMADYLRAQRDHLCGELSFEEATADNPFEFPED